MANHSSGIAVPQVLSDAVRDGLAILFLGAGASLGARHPEGKKIPQTSMLRDLLCDKFLDGKLKDRPLAEIAQYCENEIGLVALQNYIWEIFKDFTSADFHRLIPAFRWHAIATTNFDLIIEAIRLSRTSRSTDWNLLFRHVSF